MVHSAYAPRVNIKSSQQVHLSTAPRHDSPVLSFMVAEVPVVRMLSGRDGESWGARRDMVGGVGRQSELCTRATAGLLDREREGGSGAEGRGRAGAQLLVLAAEGARGGT